MTWQQSSLYRKYLVYFAAVITITLLAGGVTGLYYSYRETRAAAVELQREKVLGATAQIDRYLQPIEQQIRGTILPHQGSVHRQERFLDFLKLLRQAPAISEVSWLDENGRERLKVSRRDMDRAETGIDRSGEAAFTGARARQAYFGPVYFRDDTAPYLTIAIAEPPPHAGVVLAEVNLTFLRDIISRIRFGETGRAYVVDAAGKLISHADLSLVLRNTDLSSLPQVRRALTGGTSEEPGGTSDARDLEGRAVLTAHARIEPLDGFVFVEQQEREAFAPLYASMWRNGLLLLLGVVLAAAASALLARRMVRPIRTLQAGVARIGAGALDPRIEVKTGDELEALAAEFGRMAERLRESYDHLEQKVSERTRELATANRAVSRFLAVASHDLRQPMHALGLYVASLRDVPLPEEARRLVRQIMKSVTVSQDLLDALLDISKLDAGVIKPNLTDVPVNSLLSTMQTNFAPVARAKGVEFRIVASRATVRSDAVLLERVLLNLASNAVRYTHRGKILLGCRRRGRDLHIEVWDTGTGIPANEQHLIFEEFKRVAGSERAEEKGLGLGLAIVDRLAHLLNHCIEVRSWPGQGSVFTVVAARAEGRATEERALPVVRAGVSLKGSRIVVVDGDPAGLKATQTLLESWGCRVFTATSADEALALRAKTPRRLPDVVICDCRLIAGEPGIQAIQRLRSAFPNHMPFILITADASPDVANHAQEWGLPWLHKPVRPAKLRALLDHCLRLRAPRRRSGSRRQRRPQNTLKADG